MCKEELSIIIRVSGKSGDCELDCSLRKKADGVGYSKNIWRKNLMLYRNVWTFDAIRKSEEGGDICIGRMNM